MIQNAMFATVRSDGDFLPKQEFAGALPCTPSPRLAPLLAVLWFDLMFDVQTRKISRRPAAAKSAGLDLAQNSQALSRFRTFEPGLDLNRA
jgi:hypothetical protein